MPGQPSISQISLEAFDTLWHQTRQVFNGHSPFVLPFWLRTVWRHLGGKGEPYTLTVSDGNQLIGIVPLAVSGQTAYFSGHPDVCDYQDILTAPGRETDVLTAILDHLTGEGIGQLDLQTLRPDAIVLRALKAAVSQRSFQMRLTPDDVTYETRLPQNWEDYLRLLNAKQRHEVRRKVRRLEAHGAFTYGLAADNGAIETFLRLFQLNRNDKAEFMDAAMSDYFRDLINSLADQKMLRLYILDVAGQSAAAVLCFDYGGVRYLYNSGYDASYHKLSVGILSKVFSIQKGIETGCRYYDFLKGAESYKKRIGGREVPLYRCKIEL